MKTSVFIGIGVAGLVFGSVLSAHLMARGAWKEREKDLLEQIRVTDSLLNVYQADSVRWFGELSALRERSNVLRADSARLDSSLVRSRVVRRGVEARLSSLLSDLDRDTLPQELQDLLDVGEATLVALAEEGEACVASLENARGQRTVCEEARQIDSTRIASLELVRTRLTAERDSAQALNKPPPLFSLTFEVGVGPGCAVGVNGQVACGASLQATVLRFRLR